MPFCVQCGNQVAATDCYCARCGQRQAAATPRGPAASTAAGMPPGQDVFATLNPRTAAILCYVPLMGWLMSLVILASPQLRNKRTLRFHAFQGLYLFVAWLVLDWVIGPVFRAFPRGIGLSHAVPGVLQLGVMVGWIVMLVKTAQNRLYRLPVVGELAERSVAEQA